MVLVVVVPLPFSLALFVLSVGVIPFVEITTPILLPLWLLFSVWIILFSADCRLILSVAFRLMFSPVISEPITFISFVAVMFTSLLEFILLVLASVISAWLLLSDF